MSKVSRLCCGLGCGELVLLSDISAVSMVQSNSFFSSPGRVAFVLFDLLGRVVAFVPLNLLGRVAFFLLDLLGDGNGHSP